MKVKRPAYFATGERRPPKVGDWFQPKSPTDGDYAVMRCTHNYDPSEPREIYERREVEVEVEDPIVPWIAAYFQHSSDWDVGVRMRTLSRSYRALVEERAKAAAARVAAWVHNDTVGVEQRIREEFLR